MANKDTKKIGQFFTPGKIAQVLFDLVSSVCPSRHPNVIDPMAGNGNLLAPFLENNQCGNVCGVELDQDAYQQLVNRDKRISAYCGNSFSCWNYLNRYKEGWDVVIANPPYIRYQLQENELTIAVALKQLKACLMDANVPNEERAIFEQCLKTVSKTADYSIPCLILCSLLIKNGGILGLVVPTTWLSRDYSAPLQYLFGKLFEIKYVVHDEGSAWFDEAEVKTCLVVAKRIRPKDLSLCDKTLFKYILTGNQHLNIDELDQEGFTETLKFEQKRLNSAIREIPESALFLKLGLLETAKGFSEAEKEYFKQLRLPPSFYFVFDDIRSILSKCHKCEIDVNQGLRTGANDFFVLKILDIKEAFILAETGDWDGNKVLKLSSSQCVPLIHYATGESLVFGAEDAKEVVLTLSDANLDLNIEEYVSRAEKYVFVKDKKELHFFDLSAVKTNVSVKNPGRKWFMLPALKRRHLPNLLMPRVVGERTWCGLVRQPDNRPLAVDANFITIPCDSSKQTMLLFALFNSGWFDYCCETFGTIMGGGALKLESSMFSQVPFPTFSGGEEDKLCALAQDFINGKIDRALFVSSVDGVIFQALEIDDNGKHALNNSLAGLKRSRLND